MRIVVASRGNPLDVATHSGLPAGVLRELRPLGFDPHPLQVALPRRAERLIARAFGEPAIDAPASVALRSALGSARLRRAGDLAGVIQHGTEYRLRTAVPLVTYEDQTLAQAMRAYGYAALEALSRRSREAWLARQGAIYAQARGCCTTSEWARRSVIEDYGVPEHKVHVVGVGRNHDPLAPADRDWSTPRLLFVGLDWERKNGPRVVAAFRRLRAEHPGARLDLVGGHPPVDEPGVVGHGRLRLDDASGREQLDGLYREATCLVLPSVHEPSATVHAEAGAAGVPSIGSTAGGSATVVGDGGLLVDPGSEDALLAAMRELADPERARDLGERAREHAKLFTWSAVVGRLVRALDPPGARDRELPEFL